MYTNQASLYIILAIVFVVIAIIILSFVISVIKHKRYLDRLRQTKCEIEITTLENERKRLAADIHDELGPLLSAAKLRYGEIEVRSNEDQLHLDAGHLMIDNIVDKMRIIAKDLMPTVLLLHGPVYAIRELIAHNATNKGLQIEFITGDLPELSELHSLHLFRTIQEIIHNTVKHAAASRLKILLHREANKLIISTVDDGKGFNYREVIKEGRGLGLYNVQSRVDILKGKVFVKSKIGFGTRFQISIPL